MIRISEGGEGVTDALRPLQSKQNRLTYAGQNYIPRKDELSSPVYYYFTVSGNDFVVQQLIAFFCEISNKYPLVSSVFRHILHKL